MLVYTCDPRPRVLERFDTRQVERNYDPISLSIKRVRQVSKPLLTCCVPDLDCHLVTLICLVCRLDEVDTRRSDVLRNELSFIISLQYGCLANFAITDDDDRHSMLL